MASKPEAVPFTRVLAVGDAVMDALAETSWTLSGSGKLPLCLHGPSDPVECDWNHEHAFILPEDADNDGLLDHISVIASMGLDPSALRLLAATDRIGLSDASRLDLVLERACSRDHADCFGVSRLWASRTPYVPPVDGRSSEKEAVKILRSEIKKREKDAVLTSKPEGVSQLAYAGLAVTPAQFALERVNGKRPPRGAEPRFFRLEFEQPVAGPLAFGWACHQGLGQFAPV